MPDFAPNFTARYRLRYSTLGFNHSMLWRIDRGAGSLGLALMIDKVRQYLDATAAIRYTDWLEMSAEYAAEDVDVFSPAGIPGGIAGTAVIPVNPLSERTLALSHVGRSSAGQKARMFMWGVALSPEILGVAGDNFRVTSAENATVAAAVAELNSGSPTIVGSDSNPVIWYSYVNTKYSDFWVGRRRA